MHPTILAGILASATALAPAAAQTAYPTQPIVMVVPFTAGGPSDTIARVLAQSMSERLGQQVLVENVGGAGGTVGAGRVATAAPDGHTLLLGHISLSIAPAIYRELAFDPVADFTPVGLATDAAMAIIARPDFPAETMEEVLERIRADGETITYAHGGLGAAAHLCGMLIQEATGAQITTVPYQGTGPALTDILGGQVDLMCDQTTNNAAQIMSGDVRAYAVTSAERIETLPDLPTTSEVGLPDIQITVWHGLWGPAGMDPTVVETLRAALEAALAEEVVIDRLAAISTTPAAAEDVNPEALAEQLSSQIALWGPIIERAGIYAD